VEHKVFQKTLEIHQFRGVDGDFFRSVIHAAHACNAVCPNSVKFTAVPITRKLSFDLEISTGDIDEETQALRVLRTRLAAIPVADPVVWPTSRFD